MAVNGKYILRKRVSAARLLYWMLSLTMFADFLNGLVPKMNFGTIYRFILLAFTLYITATHSRKQFLPVIAFILFFLCNTLVSSFDHGSISGIVYDVKMMMRVMTSMSICSAIISLYQKNKFSFRMIQKVIENNLMYTPALFIGTYILGIGSVSYEHNSVGFKSVFLSLNSVNVALIVMFAYAVFQIFVTGKILRWCTLAIYVMLPMLMLGTKTALALIVLIPSVCIILNLKTKRGRYIGGTILLLIVFFMIFWLDDVLQLLQDVLERQIFLFQNRDLISYLFSGRNWVMEDALHHYATEFSVVNYLFGDGYYNSHHEISRITGYLTSNAVRPIEMDWADILLAYGPLGFIPTYGYSLKILLRSTGVWKRKTVQPYFVTASIIVAFGTLAGHVYVEAISSTFLAFMLCAVYIGTSDLKLGRLIEVSGRSFQRQNCVAIRA